jgi:glycosyltransferase involved in cell wall biosynthesis
MSTKPTSLHILVQHCHHPDQICGVLSYVKYLEAGLSEMGHTVHTVSTRFSSLWDWLREIIQADIVHMNSNHLGFALLCKLLGKKVIIKYHYLFYQSTHFDYQKMGFWERLRTEFMASLPPRSLPLRWKLHVGVKWLRLAIRLSTAFLVDRHIACSHFLAESLSFPWPVLAIYNPISPAPLTERSHPKSLADLKTPYTFAFVGRICADKGVDVLLRAVYELKQRQQQFKLLLIGDGDSRQACVELAQELEISEYVEFCGKKSQAEVVELLRQVLALVVPSRWQDPAPYVVLEAGSQQTCAIVSQMGGLPEVAGNCSYTIPSEDSLALADAMHYCLEHPQDSLQRGKHLLEHTIEQFTPAVTVTRFIQICEQLLGTGKPRHSAPLPLSVFLEDI